MKFLKIFVLALFFVAKAHGELQCYTCENCPTVSKTTQVKSCQSDETSTTIADPSGTSTSKSEAPGVPTTTPQSGLPNESSTTVADPSATSTTKAEAPGVLTTTSQSPASSTTHESPASSTTPESVASSSTSESVASTSTISPGDGSAVKPKSNLDILPQVFRISRKLNAIREETNYRCYTIQHKVENKIVTKRGCTKFETDNASTCKRVGNSLTETKNCKLCNKNKCNGSATVQYSLLTLLSFFVITRIFT